MNARVYFLIPGKTFFRRRGQTGTQGEKPTDNLGPDRGKDYSICLKLVRNKVPAITIDWTSVSPASRALTKLQKAAFRKTEPLYLVEAPALGKPFWELIF
jgi:hypothetical protein